MSEPALSTDKRNAILEAALDLFVERGFHGTAVPEVAKRAGVGAGTIYRYFESKEALVNALYREWKERLASHLLDRFPFGLTPREQFAAYWNRYMDFARKHPRAQAFLELHHHADYLDSANRALEERLFQIALGVVERMRQGKAVKDLPGPLIMAFVFGAIVGLIRASWHRHIELTDEVVAAGEQCCWEAIRA
jgi:AcrR family transcriptional regulator